MITTHSMEEADALCTRIGIVCDGNLQVLGSQLHLKKKFGEGLKVVLRFSVDMPPGSAPAPEAMAKMQKEHIDRVSHGILGALRMDQPESRHIVKLVSSDMEIAQANATASFNTQQSRDVSWMVTLECNLPPHAVDLADVFLSLEAACKELNVADWALTETTLEDVFVSVASSFM
jgi:ABC-type multidrug transport system ATPase subunit